MLKRFLFLVASVFFLGCAPAKDSTTVTTPAPCTSATPPPFSSVQTIFSNSCGGCHGFQNYSTASTDSANIYTRVSNGSMPQGGSLSATDKNAIEQWVSCGSKP
ncbi:MAG: c-type cytochrome [Pseudobdellovibrionaceae bacterium]